MAIGGYIGGYWRLYVATGIPHGWMGSEGLLAAILAATASLLSSQLLLPLCCCWNSLLNSDETGNPRLLYLLCERSHDQWDDTENELEG